MPIVLKCKSNDFIVLLFLIPKKQFIESEHYYIGYNTTYTDSVYGNLARR